TVGHPRAQQLALHHRENLFHPRLDYFSEQAARDHPRFASADSRHLDHLLAAHDLVGRHAEGNLEPLRFGNRRAQSRGDIAGPMISVVPPPTSISATPSSRSSGNSAASADASGWKTISDGVTPARSQHLVRFCP